MKTYRIALVAILALMGIRAAAQLPDNAVKVAEYLAFDLWVSGDDQPGNSSLWATYASTGKVERLVQSHPFGDINFDDYAFGSTDGKVVPETMVHSISRAAVLDGAIIVFEGCPDSRNVFTYVLNRLTGQIIQLPSNNGFIGFTNEDCDIIAESYDYYPQGGRYSVINAYDVNGKRLSTMRVLHEQ